MLNCLSNQGSYSKRGELCSKLLTLKSLTTDKGAEFINAESLSLVVGGPVFYCNPYHSQGHLAREKLDAFEHSLEFK